MSAATTKRTRRTEEQMIEELKARIAHLTERKERKKVTKDPALRFIAKAVKVIDQAVVSTQDKATRAVLADARASLSACLALGGVMMPAGSGGRAMQRSSGNGTVSSDALLRYVSENPGQRGEQIAAALGTDSNTMRPVMKRLIEDRKVKTKGERRGMSYAAV